MESKLEAFFALLDSDLELEAVYQRFCELYTAVERFGCFEVLDGFVRCHLLASKQMVIALWLMRREYPDLSGEDFPFSSLFADVGDVFGARFMLTNPSKAAHKTAADFCSGKEDTFYVSCDSLVIIPEANEAPTLSRETLLRELMLNGSFCAPFSSPFIRPPPPLHDLCQDELNEVCILSNDSPPLLFDDQIDPDSSGFLLNRAITRRLSKKESLFLSSAVISSPEIFAPIASSKQTVSAFIENNPRLARTVFTAIHDKLDPSVLDYFTELPLTPKLATVAAGIILNGNPPQSFPDIFIQSSLLDLKSEESTNSKNIALFLDVTSDLIEQGVQFSDYLLIDLHEFAADPKYASYPSAARLFQITPN